MPLVDDLRKTQAYFLRLAGLNYIGAYTLAVISATASVSAAILAAAGAGKVTIGVLAATPAAVLAANAVLKFDSKASWHWRKAKRLAVLLRALEYQNASESDIAQKWSQIDIDMERDWQPLGGLTPPEQGATHEQIKA
jgi:hypothetical protein